MSGRKLPAHMLPTERAASKIGTRGRDPGMEAGMSGQVQEYRGKKVVVRFDAEKCIHSRNCVLGRPEVWVARSRSVMRLSGLPGLITLGGRYLAIESSSRTIPRNSKSARRAPVNVFVMDRKLESNEGNDLNVETLGDMDAKLFSNNPENKFEQKTTEEIAKALAEYDVIIPY